MLPLLHWLKQGWIWREIFGQSVVTLTLMKGTQCFVPPLHEFCPGSLFTDRQESWLLVQKMKSVGVASVLGPMVPPDEQGWSSIFCLLPLLSNT